MSTDREPNYLTREEEDAERNRVEARGKFLFRYVAQVIIGAPLRPGRGPINTASAVVVRLPGGLVVATANHVLAQFEQALRSDPDLSFQVGNLNLQLPGRSIWRDVHDDLVMLSVTEQEAQRIGTTIHEPPVWPPQVPATNSFVTIVGLPAMTRSRPDSSTVIFGPLIAHLPVLGSFANHFTCRVDRDYLESLLNRSLPTENVDYGGMSGGPVFLEQDLHYPLVGLVKELHPGLEYFVIQGLARAPDVVRRP